MKKAFLGKKNSLLLFIFPFITACQSLSQISAVRKPAFLQQKSGQSWHYIKGEWDSRQKKHKSALSSFTQALSDKPDSFFLRFRLAKEYWMSGQELPAYQLWAKMREKAPHNTEVRFRLAEVYESHKLYHSALKEYKKILQLNPSSYQALYRKVLLDFEQGLDILPALNILEQRASEEELYKVHYLKSRAYQRENKARQAFLALKKSIFLNSHFLPALQDILSPYYSHWGLETISLMESLKAQADPRQVHIPLLLVQLYMQYNELDKARQLLGFLIEEDPKELSLKIQLAGLLAKYPDKEEESLLLVQEILEEEPAFSAGLYLFSAQNLYKKEDFSSALEVLQTAEKYFPKDEEILFYKGILYHQLGEEQKAINSMQAVLAVNTQNVAALNYLSFIYAEMNQNLKSAEQMAQKALSLSPGDSYILDTVGWVFFKRGKLNQAVKYLEQAYAGNTGESLIAEHLAEVYYKLDMFDKSIDLYKKAIIMEPDAEKRRRLQEKLLAIQMSV